MVVVTTAPPEGGADATVTMTREAFGHLLRGEPVPPGHRPIIRGDRAAVALLKAGSTAPRACERHSPLSAGSAAAPSGRAHIVAAPVSTPACAHLHVHSEYSLLDGAANIDGPGRPRGRLRPAGDRPHRPRRHERLGRALQGLQEARRQADPRPRGLLRRRPHGPRGQDRAQPPDAARRQRRGLPQPRQALERRLPRGPVPRQAGRRPRAARAPRRGRHRALRLPGRRAPAAASSRAGCRRARAHLDDLVQIFGPEDVYFEVQRNGIAEQEQVNEEIAKFAQEMGRPLVATADVHYLRKEDYHHHAALLCVQTKSTLAAAEDVLRHQRVLFEELGGDGGGVRRHARRRSPRRSRSPSAATRRSRSSSS